MAGPLFVSLVGFRFCDARLFGVRIPWHQHFAEVNLRFYVRRRVDGAWRRGVVFLRELAAKRAVAAVAKWFYGERFRRVPLQCRVDRPAADSRDAPRRIEYAWRDRGRDYLLAGDVLDAPQTPEPDSLAEFVVEHYWAYTAARRGGANEYLVTHPPWRIAPADGVFTGDAYRQYGPRFAPFLRGEPASAFWADGSAGASLSPAAASPFSRDAEVRRSGASAPADLRVAVKQLHFISSRSCKTSRTRGTGTAPLGPAAGRAPAPATASPAARRRRTAPRAAA